MAAVRTGQAQLLADGVPIPNEIIALGDRFTSSGAPTLRCRGPVVATTHQVSNWNSARVPAMTSTGPLAGAVALARRGELFSVMAGRVVAAGAVALIVVDASTATAFLEHCVADSGADGIAVSRQLTWSAHGRRGDTDDAERGAARGGEGRIVVHGRGRRSRHHYLELALGKS